MSEYMFNVKRGRQSTANLEKRRSIAAKHGIDYVYACIPGSGWLGWYTGPNLGDPHDRELARAVSADEEAALPSDRPPYDPRYPESRR